MKAPTISSISAEDLQGDDALPRLLQALNPFMGQVVQALSGQLEWENFRAELKTLDVKVPEPAWIAPTLLNSWVNYGSPWETVGYRIDPQGMVHIKGLVKNGTVNATIFSLPVGYRPREAIHLATESASAHGVIQVGTGSGDEVRAASGSNAWFSLACSFLATNPAPPAAFTGAGWPLFFATKIADPKLVIPIQVQDAQASAKTTFVGPTLDWERTGDGRIKIKSIHGLTAGRTYKVTVLVTG